MFLSYERPIENKQAERLSALGPVYTMNLGDLAHELYWYTYDFNLKDAVNTLLENRYPTLMYSVSGNHDNDGAIHTDNTDRDAEHLYREVLGPEYYSMNIGGEHWIMMDDILYVKADGDYIVIHKADGKTLMTLMTLKSLEKQLPFDRFCRTHRSWIVNVDKARGIRDGKILVGDAVIPLSDSCKAAFFELLSHKSIFLKAEPTVRC